MNNGVVPHEQIPARLESVLDQALAKLEAVQRAKSEPIAVVGLACRFPGAENPDAYWNVLQNGIDTIADVPADRWDVDAHFDSDPAAIGKMYVRKGGFLPRVDGFDAGFFEISPREAASMDPQQRLALEIAWEALEHAGLSATKLAGSATAVFMGATTNDYASLLARAGAPPLDAYFSTGNALNAIAGRIAHILGLQGPCLTVDTACSSSLVAVHLACQSLRSGECDTALAGGVNLILAPEVTIAICRAGMLAADGRCKTFDASADGYVRSEGCGVVVLKRLSDALSANDRVLALVRGSATNQDGASGGFTVPSGRAQESLIRRALGNASVSATDIDYLEAHGTGTALGDPIEVKAAANVLAAGRTPERPLLLGSAKTNIGHTEAAAGIAGFIKVVLALQHGAIPPHLHFRTPNPHIPWSQLRIAVARAGKPWPRNDRPRLAGISSFGATGTNAHVVMQESPTVATPIVAGPDRKTHLLALSAKTRPALRELAERYAAHIREQQTSFANLCFTANTGRAHFPVRAHVVAETGAQVLTELQALIAQKEFAEASPRREEPKLAFLFTGQGSQYHGMGRVLDETQPTFRKALDRCADILRDCVDQPLREILHADPSCLDDTAYTQPALFALEFALAELWKSWGVGPAAVMGHSVGEYVAACVAGVFSLEDALWLISRRAQLMGRLPAGGAMAAVAAGYDTVKAAIARYPDEISIAAVNAPEQTVISGSAARVEAVLADLARSGISATRLTVSHAFHSPLVAPMLAEFERVARQIQYRAPKLLLVSNVTGAPVTDEVTDPAYWVRHVREPVRFMSGIAALRERGCNIFMELGPGRTLLQLGRISISDPAIAWLGSLHQGGGDWRQMLDSAGKLYDRGCAIDWDGFDRDYVRTRVSLPTYPWQRESHWGPPRRSSGQSAATLRDEDMLYEVAWRAQAAPAPAKPADYWPLPQDVKAHLQPQIAAFAPDYVDAEYRRVLAELDALCIDYVAQAWEALGWRFQPGTRCRGADLAERLGVAERHRRLLARTAEILAEGGLLRRAGEFWETAAPFTSRQPGRQVAMLLASCPATAAECTLLERCASRLSDVLRGSQNPLQLLFPEGDVATASSLYRDSPGARLMNRMLDESVEHALGYLPAGRKLRVLEVGGGTGGATVGLLQILPPDRTEYVFTDISPRFTNAAEEQFGKYGFVRYRTLDIERDPDAQNFAGEAFDLIIAANVLHATKDLTQSLRHVRQLAAPGAMLLLLEGTAPIRALDLIFGMTEGWWRFADHQMRPAYPLISPTEWAAVLDRVGFADTTPLVFESEDSGILSRQAVIVARATEEMPGHKIKDLPHWIILSDHAGHGSLLAARHRTRGGAASLVYAGDRFEVVDTHAYRAAPHQTTDFRRLLASLPPAKSYEIVHLWSLDEPAIEHRGDQVTEAGAMSCGSIVSLVQACIDFPNICRTWLVSRAGGGADAPNAVASLGQSGLWGLGRVLAAEHPELHAIRLDLDPAAATGQSVDALWNELSLSPTEDEVSFRQGARYVSRLVRHNGGTHAPAAFRGDASYLISGGLGGLGLLTAQWMIARGAKTLVLAGRQVTEERAQNARRTLESNGVRVIIHQTDFVQRRQVADLLREIEQLPPLRGIVHAAGALDDGLLRHLTWERFAGVLRPKLAGAWNLHALTADIELDFFVLYSSFAAIQGTPGQGNHAAANAFLDALAWHRRARGLPALSINWGAWSQIGAAAQRGVGERAEATGGGAMNPEQGLRLLERMWHAKPAQIAAVPIHWERLEQQQRSRPLLRELAPRAKIAAPARSDILARLGIASPQRRRALMLDHVLAETAQVLGVKRADGIEPQRGFFELGMDSLTSVELRNRLGATLQRTFATSLAFDHPTPEELTQFLLGELEPAAAAHHDAPRPSARPAIKPTRPQREPVDESELTLAELEDMIDELAGPAP